MQIFAISDLHLSFGTDKPMDIFYGWQNYTDKIKSNWCRIVGEDDIVVIPGDFSWALKLEETLKDFQFLENLPGKKILIKGNHDLWWSTAKKIHSFFEANNFKSIEIVFNSYYEVENFAICGSRGWFIDKQSDMTIVNREAGRVRSSLEKAKEAGLTPLLFLHYPPVYAGEICRPILDVIKEFNITQVYHGHIHGNGLNRQIKDFDGISFKLLSCDCINFTPFLIKDIK